MKVHPYIPNSVPETRDEMLREIGVPDIETLYRDIPTELRLGRPLRLPEPFPSEYDLKQHVQNLLSANKTCDEYANFLGAGCYQHFVPAVCDEINSRGEFLTAYAGATYSDHGKHQAWFEFQSMLGELLDMDVVGFPTYDWGTAAGSAMRMACRLTGRHEVIVPRNLNPERLVQLRTYTHGSAELRQADYDPKTGQMNLTNLRHKLSAQTAAVYFENPTFFGILEECGKEISELAHAAGALSVVGVDPITLGVIAPPSAYGADLVCGDVQPLGIHMQAGGGLCGFIASSADLRLMAEYPTLFETIGKTQREGEYGFGWATLERTSYDLRDKSRDFTGTSTGLWAITAGVYMALLGPQGIREVDEAILLKSQYTLKRLAEIPGLRVPVFAGTPFREFVVNFDGTGKRVREINRALLERGIFGGKDISVQFPQLGQAALYCVTEVTTLSNIVRLADALKEIVA